MGNQTTALAPPQILPEFSSSISDDPKSNFKITEKKSSQISQSSQALPYIPQNYSKSDAKHDISSNIMKINQVSSTDTNKLSVTTETQPRVSLTKISHCRIAFVDLNEFYRSWKSIPRDTLFDVLLILPKINPQWILNPNKYLNEYSEVLLDDVFVNLLKWKYHQGLLFCNDKIIIRKVKLDNEQKEDGIDPFWKYLSDNLIDLDDPVSFRRSSYNPLILTKTFYESDLFQSKYKLTSKEIMCALKDLSKTNRLNEVIQELLFQCNPSLKVLIKYDEDHIDDVNELSGMSDISGFPYAVHNIKGTSLPSTLHINVHP